MRLALASGRLDVDRLAQELGSTGIAEWEAFERIEGGFGARAAWLQTAVLAALYAESHRDSKKRAKPFTAEDFLPWVERAQFSPAAFRRQFSHLTDQKKRG